MTLVSIEAVFVCPCKAHPREVNHLIRDRFFAQVVAVVFRTRIALKDPRIVGLVWSRKSDQTSAARSRSGDPACFSGCLKNFRTMLGVFARIYNLVLILMRI